MVNIFSECSNIENMNSQLKSLIQESVEEYFKLCPTVSNLKYVCILCCGPMIKYHLDYNCVCDSCYHVQTVPIVDKRFIPLCKKPIPYMCTKCLGSMQHHEDHNSMCDVCYRAQENDEPYETVSDDDESDDESSDEESDDES